MVGKQWTVGVSVVMGTLVPCGCGCSRGRRGKQQNFLSRKRECDSIAGSDRIENGLSKRIMNCSAPDFSPKILTHVLKS